jgi:hypothetical protein
MRVTTTQFAEMNLLARHQLPALEDYMDWEG